MADKSLKSITFPQLGNTYKIPELANNFSASTAYAAGDYVIYSGKLYRFTAAHSAGAWNAAHVTEAKLAADLASNVSGIEAAIDDLLENNVASVFDATEDYETGDYVVYNRALYKFTSDHDAGAWDANDVEAVGIADEVSDLKTALRSGDEEDAEWHLGFYLDENGDLCQVDDE